MVDSTQLPEVDINRIATDLNGKADTDLTNTTDQAKILMGGMAMPSNKYINLTLGASGTRYTAPADGYLYFSKRATGPNQWWQMSNGVYSESKWSSGDGQAISGAVPTRKGNSMDVYYSLGGQTLSFQFFYAVGSESEAS